MSVPLAIGAYRPSPGVMWAIHVDRVVVLSLAANRVYVLEDEATEIWKAVARTNQLSAATTCHGAASGCCSESDAHLAGAGTVISQLCGTGLIEPRSDVGVRSTGAPKGRAPRGSSAARRIATMPEFLAVLLQVKLMLRVSGLLRTVDWVAAYPISEPTVCSTNVPAIYAHRVSAAASLLPARAECLEQSLCLTLMLKKAGYAAGLEFGARAYPCGLHSWVQIAETIVNDSEDRTASFVRMKRG